MGKIIIAISGCTPKYCPACGSGSFLIYNCVNEFYECGKCEAVMHGIRNKHRVYADSPTLVDPVFTQPESPTQHPELKQGAEIDIEYEDGTREHVSIKQGEVKLGIPILGLPYPTQHPDQFVEPNKMVLTQNTVKTYTLPDADGVIIPKKEYEKFKEFISSKTTEARENCPWKCKSDAESCLCRSKSPD